MRGPLLIALLSLLGAPSAWGGAPLSQAQLLRILPPASSVRGGFDAVEEMPVDPSGDETLRSWGVRATRARHYTRDASAGVQVCSIEVWEFRSEAQANAALAGIQYPEWKFLRRGSLMLMARGLTNPRGGPPRRGVFPECQAILERAAERAPRS